MGQRDSFIVIVLLAAVVVGGVLLWRMRDEVPEVVQQVMSPDAGVVAAPPTEMLPDAGMPSLIGKRTPDGDHLLRKRVGAGTKSSQLLGWLSAPDVLQRIAAASRLVADGKSPRPVLMFVEVTGDFAVDESKPGKIYIHPGSYARYDPLIDALTSVKPAYAARVYSDLRPYFEAAFSQVARPGERFDDVLSSAVLRVTSVKVPEGPIELVEKGAIFLYADPALESLTPAEKHVLRMGPKNVDALQRWLKTFSRSVGLRLAK